MKVIVLYSETVCDMKIFVYAFIIFYYFVVFVLFIYISLLSRINKLFLE